MSWSRRPVLHSRRVPDLDARGIGLLYALNTLGAASKANCDWRFLTDLRDRGRATAEQWLAENYLHLGKRATVDLVNEYLNPDRQ